MPFLYRVEDDEGKGIYHSNKLNCSLQMRGIEKHPSPYDDSQLRKAVHRRKYLIRTAFNGRIYFSPNMFHYGFADLEQLERWIYEASWRREMKKKGFKINVYKCKKAAFAAGSTQAVCLKNQINHKPNRVLVSTFELDAL